jgi:hypothetical protein
VLKPDGSEVEVENNRVTIDLHVTADTPYYAKSVGISIKDILTGVAALVAAVGGAVLMVRKVVPRWKSKKSEETSDATSDDGYL